MSDSEDLFRFVEDIADQAVRRMNAWKQSQEPLARAAPAKPATGRVDPDTLRSAADLAPYIDHTLLKPEARAEDVVKVAEEARQHGFATVCVNSAHVATAARVLAGSA